MEPIENTVGEDLPVHEKAPITVSSFSVPGGGAGFARRPSPTGAAAARVRRQVTRATRRSPSFGQSKRVGGAILRRALARGTPLIKSTSCTPTDVAHAWCRVEPARYRGPRAERARRFGLRERPRTAGAELAGPLITGSRIRNRVRKMPNIFTAEHPRLNTATPRDRRASAPAPDAYIRGRRRKITLSWSSDRASAAAGGSHTGRVEARHPLRVQVLGELDIGWRSSASRTSHGPICHEISPSVPRTAPTPPHGTNKHRGTTKDHGQRLVHLSTGSGRERQNTLMTDSMSRRRLFPAGLHDHSSVHSTTRSRERERLFGLGVDRLYRVAVAHPRARTFLRR